MKYCNECRFCVVVCECENVPDSVAQFIPYCTLSDNYVGLDLLSYDEADADCAFDEICSKFEPR